MDTSEKIALREYLISVELKHQQLEQKLSEYAQKSIQGSLSEAEYFATERLIQVLVESSMGISKQWIRQLDRSIPESAYGSFQQLYRHGHIDKKELNVWRSVIGLRNALVHDYLNIDPDVVIGVLESRQYEVCLTFCRKAKKAMLEDS